KAGPASTPPACIGRSEGPPAVKRCITSLILATGMAAKDLTSAAPTARVRWHILISTIVCLLNKLRRFYGVESKIMPNIFAFSIQKYYEFYLPNLESLDTP